MTEAELAQHIWENREGFRNYFTKWEMKEELANLEAFIAAVEGR